MADEGQRTGDSTGSTRRSSDNASRGRDAGPANQSQSQSQSSSAQFGTASQMSSSSRFRRPQPLHAQTEGYGSINANPPPQRPRDQAASPETLRPKKPAMSRRATSTHLPHKGEEFSVDDDELEVALDQELGRHKDGGKSSTGSIRRQPSTIKRRPTVQPPSLTKVDSLSDDEDETPDEPTTPTAVEAVEPMSPGQETVQADEACEPTEDEGLGIGLEDEEANGQDEEEDDGELSDAESFTLKDRQDAINTTHPFGIRIWKPALYKKHRSIQRNAEGDIHSSPGLHVSKWLFFFNILWTLLFGWWLAIICVICAVFELLFTPFSESSWEYATLLGGLAKYIFFPFGKFVKLVQDEAYAEEDEGEGRSISEYEQWQSGDLEEGRLFFGPQQRSLVGRRRTSLESSSETQSLLGRPGRNGHTDESGMRGKSRLFGRGKWNLGRIVFFFVFYGLICPPLLLVSIICWLFVFTIPMGRVTLLLFGHLRTRPLALTFHSDSHDTRHPNEPPSSILVCTYRAVGLKYWKYTIDGTNIFLINLLAIVAFTIFDFFILDEVLGIKIFLTSAGLLFALALFSIIPLAYFIGQAVASISAQSSMGVGATVNAFFATVVEVYLYCVALNEGKAQLVEGSIIGSIFAGILLLPGVSMCFGALKRKTQRFNVKSAGVTSTMMLFAVIGAFGPTLFYQIYGSHELKCHQCTKEDVDHSADRDCRRCFFSQTPGIHDAFYINAVQPYIWFSAVMLFLSYVIGLLFTLRTHAAIIWNAEIDEKKAGGEGVPVGQANAHGESVDPHGLVRQSTFNSLAGTRSDIRDSQLYQRILGQSLRQPSANGAVESRDTAKTTGTDEQRPEPASIKSPYIVPPKSRDGDVPGFHLQGLSEQDNSILTRQVAEIVATAAAVAARDASKAPQKVVRLASEVRRPGSIHRSQTTRTAEQGPAPIATDAMGQTQGGGHDAPNWSRAKSTIILLTATVAYALIAEILVKTVDSVLQNFEISEKFLGISIFALVPNTTEFLNAISFAMNGNIALSMEIGSAYALQVCLLQIPALVLYSALSRRFFFPHRDGDEADIMSRIFTLIFPQWDMVTVILSIILLSYVYGEGKSNYFKGSILILSYMVVVVGFYFAGFDAGAADGVDAWDTLALGSSPMFASKHGFVMVG